MSKRCRLFSAALALMAGAATVEAPTVGQATLLDFQLTVGGSAGNLPETFMPLGTEGTATTFFSFSSVTAPTQTTANPGDTIEVDLLAPAGLQFVVANPAGALTNAFAFTIATASAAGNPVATGTASVTGEGGSGTIVPHGGQLIQGSGWFYSPSFTIAGTVSFTELSAQFVVPAGVTLPLTALTEVALDFVVVSTDPGDFVSLEAIPAAVPEPASLALLGTALAGLGLLRRRRRKRGTQA